MGNSQSLDSISDIANASDNEKVSNSKMRKEKKCIEDSTFHNFFNNPLTEDLLIEILSFVPCTDLLLNCRLVCKEWKELIDSQTVWRLKCERENIEFPTISRRFPTLPQHHYRYIYLYCKSKKNLLKNPCGEDHLSKWQLLKSFGDGLIIEKPAQGCEPVPSEVGSESCFATSYGQCSKFQVIDLYEEKHNRYLLLNDLVTIKVGEWYGARNDCGSVYSLKIDLLNDSFDLVDRFKFTHNFQQWNGGSWHFVDHEFSSDVQLVRYVHFKHTGCDTQYWAGHYGSKFTGGFVELNLI